MSIGRVAPMPNQIATNVPTRKKIIAIGRRKGFWNLLILSTNGTVSSPAGTAAISKTPRSLFGTVRRSWKVGKKYHSGRISSGVANGFAGSPFAAGSRTANPITQAKVPRITTGNI